MVDNIQKIAQDLLDEWRDDHEDNLAEMRQDPDGAKEQAAVWIIENSADAVPAMTTVLFQMVVDDNRLAFLDGPIASAEPFEVLSAAIRQEVERMAIDKIHALIEEGANA